MEIIHLILGKANPDRLNGVNKCIYQLVSNQSSKGRAVSVWGITNDLDHNYKERNFETVLFQACKNPFKISADLRAAIVSKKGKAVFHLHGGWIPVYFTISKLFNANNINFVVTPYGAYNTIAMQRSYWRKRVYFHLFEKKFLERTHKIHLVGESEPIGIQKIYPNKKLQLLPFGFDFSGVNNPEKSNDGEFVLGYLGRLDIYHKGLDILLEAFYQFQVDSPCSKLWIIGDGEGKSKMQKFIHNKGIEEKVIFLGKKFGKEKIDLMQKMDVFVHSSRMEGMPNSVMEALDYGIPVVITKATNLAHYVNIGNNGVVVEDQNPKALANAFGLMYQKKIRDELRQLSINAQKTMRQYFDWNIVVNKFDELYK